MTSVVLLTYCLGASSRVHGTILQTPQVPGIPSGLGIRGSQTISPPPMLTWTPVNGANRYEVAIRVKASGRVLHQVDWVIVPYYLLQTAMPDQSYEWHVRACTSLSIDAPCGSWSPWAEFQR
jgi:hypothetical protein